MSAEKFAAIFDGLKEAYGYFKIEKTGTGGKTKGKAGVIRQPRPEKVWENHLSGKVPGWELSLSTKTICADGGASTSISTR